MCVSGGSNLLPLRGLGPRRGGGVETSQRVYEREGAWSQDHKEESSVFLVSPLRLPLYDSVMCLDERQEGEEAEAGGDDDALTLLTDANSRQTQARQARRRPAGREARGGEPWPSVPCAVVVWWLWWWYVKIRSSARSLGCLARSLVGEFGRAKFDRPHRLVMQWRGWRVCVRASRVETWV